MATIRTNSKPAKWIAKRPDHERRTTDNYRFYNSRAWRRESRRFRIEFPLCAECLIEGLTMPGDCVDHIDPIESGGSKWDWDNFQTLCNRHHAIKSGREAHR